MKWHIVSHRPSSTKNKNKPMPWPISVTFQILGDKKTLQASREKKIQVIGSLSGIRMASHFPISMQKERTMKQGINFPSGLWFLFTNLEFYSQTANQA